MYSRNLIMLRDGYAPAADVARALSKSLSTIHRMVEHKRCKGAKDGRALYIHVDSLVAHFKAEQNDAMVKELLAMKARNAADVKARSPADAKVRALNTAGRER